MFTDPQISRRQAMYIAGAGFFAGCSTERSREITGDERKTEAIMNTVDEAWTRIHAWLSVHAPRIMDNLNPPATDAELREAEESFGCKMPAEWQSLYRTHNGMNSESNMGSLFCGMQFLPLDLVIGDHAENVTLSADLLPVRSADEGVRKENMYNAKWIAFAHDGGDTLLRIDLDPAGSGSKGQVIFTDHDDDTVILLNNSLLGFLSDFVRDLEAGRYFLNQEALSDGDEFLDCDPEIDVVNWAHSPRWKHHSRRRPGP
jgi:cell wall assembly regulator SMI1